MTDILLANINGAVGVLTSPLDTSNESLSIRISRRIE